MEKTIKEFEERAKRAVEELGVLLGAKQIEVRVMIDPYERVCQTTVQFYNSESKNSCGPGNAKVD